MSLVWICKICGERFVVKSSLRAHFEKEHPETYMLKNSDVCKT